jgi:hypothetical protein
MIVKTYAKEQYVHNLMHGSIDMLKLLEGETLVARTKGLLINSDANGFDMLSYMKKLDILQFGKLLLYTHTNYFRCTRCSVFFLH